MSYLVKPDIYFYCQGCLSWYIHDTILKKLGVRAIILWHLHAKQDRFPFYLQPFGIYLWSCKENIPCFRLVPRSCLWLYLRETIFIHPWAKLYRSVSTPAIGVKLPLMIDCPERNFTTHPVLLPNNLNYVNPMHNLLNFEPVSLYSYSS